MKKLWLCLAMCLVVCGGCKREKWRTFTSKPGQFSVEVPGKMEKRVENARTRIGVIKAHLYLLQRGSRVFMVAHADYPRRVVSRMKPEVMLRGAVKGALRRITQTKMLEQKLFKMGSIPAIKFRAEGFRGKTKFVLVGRIFLRDNRLFQAFVLHKAGRSGAFVQKYLDSFRITAS